MIRTMFVTESMELICDLSIDQVAKAAKKWYWLDFCDPTEDETILLKTAFNFHPISIEDCFHALQRPKLDYYDSYDFFILHSLDEATLTPIEVNIFLSHEYIVTFHLSPVPEIDSVFERVRCKPVPPEGTMHILYMVMDKIVDQYFPEFYRIEDELGDIANQGLSGGLIVDVNRIRGELLKLRRSISPMQELLYRILNSSRLEIPEDQKAYFSSVHDHLHKLSEAIDSNREITADIRDSYISLNSNRMNTIMKTLTVVTSIFIPLTFIASIYGMNFKHMPELRWPWGYFGVLGIMLVIGSGMIIALWRKGWFR